MTVEEQKPITFSHKEVVVALLKEKGIREGLWGIFMEFGIAGANVGSGPNDINPAAIVPVLRIGLQKFSEPNNLTVDAATIGKEKQTT